LCLVETDYLARNSFVGQIGGKAELDAGVECKYREAVRARESPSPFIACGDEAAQASARPWVSRHFGEFHIFTLRANAPNYEHLTFEPQQ